MIHVSLVRKHLQLSLGANTNPNCSLAPALGINREIADGGLTLVAITKGYVLCVTRFSQYLVEFSIR